MPAIKVTNQATSTDALSALDFANLLGSAYVTLYASGVTNTDAISLRSGARSLVIGANPNIEASADVVDIDRDLILPREVVLAGRLILPCTVTTALNFLLIIEPILA